MSSINSLLESAAGTYKNLQNDAARMASKWAKTGLLEGLGNETDRNNMSMILENQAKQLVRVFLLHQRLLEAVIPLLVGMMAPLLTALVLRI